MPLVPFSALHYLNNKFLDLLFHLRQEQAWQVLHLNLLICTVQLRAVGQVFPAFSKGLIRCSSLLNISMLLTDIAILAPLFFSSRDKVLEVLITGKAKHTVFVLSCGPHFGHAMKATSFS